MDKEKAHIHLRLDPALADKIKKAADAEDRSVNQFLVVLIKKALKK